MPELAVVGEPEGEELAWMVVTGMDKHGRCRQEQEAPSGPRQRVTAEGVPWRINKNKEADARRSKARTRPALPRVVIEADGPTTERRLPPAGRAVRFHLACGGHVRRR